MDTAEELELEIPIEAGKVRARLAIAAGATAIVLLARTGEPTSRTRSLAAHLQRRGFGTFTVELLTEVERADPELQSLCLYDVRLLGRRLAVAIELVSSLLPPSVRFGIFGSGTGAAAVLITAASHVHLVHAVVLGAGRPDLAVFALPGVQAATLMIVGEKDEPARHWNELAAVRLRAPRHLHVVPGASRDFDEVGALDGVLHVTSSWFEAHLLPGLARKQHCHGQIAASGASGHAELVNIPEAT